MLDVRQYGVATIIEVREDLDIATAATLESAIVVAEGTATSRIFVSLEYCPYCDSTALAVLVRAPATDTTGCRE